MNHDQLEKTRSGKGFIAALDQSGGSSPKALRLYGLVTDRKGRHGSERQRKQDKRAENKR